MVQNKKQNNKKKSENSEVIGVILIMVSAFFLLCLILGNWFISDISLAVKNVTVGTIGFMAYPIFLAALFSGIALLRKQSASVDSRYIGGAIVITVFVALIMQLAMTHSYLDRDIGEYISTVFNSFTAGGIVFGTVAYAVQAVVTPVFAYIVFALGILFTALFMSWDKIKKPAAREQASVKSAPKSDVPPSGNGGAFVNRAVPKTQGMHGLYVDRILPRPEPEYYQPPQPEPERGGYSSVGGSFESLNTKDVKRGLSDYSTANPDFMSYGTNKDEKPAKRRNIIDEARASSPYNLFPSQGSSPSGSSSYGSGGSSGTYTPQGVLPPIISTPPDVRTVAQNDKRPPKYVHLEDTGLQSVVVPPPKDFEDSIVGGHIINGDELSRRIAEERGGTPAERDKPRAAEPSATPVFSSAPQEEEEPELPPILNGDYFNSAKNKSADVVEFKSEPVKTGLPPIIQASQVPKAETNEPQYKKLGIPEIFIPPSPFERSGAVISNEIVNGETYSYNDEKDFFDSVSAQTGREQDEKPANRGKDTAFKSVSDFEAELNKPVAAPVEREYGNYTDFLNGNTEIEDDSYNDDIERLRLAELERNRKDELERSRRDEMDRIRKAEEVLQKAEQERQRRAEQESQRAESERRKSEWDNTAGKADERIIDDDDEVEDLTARGFDNPSDRTGYYNLVEEPVKTDTSYKSPIGFGSAPVKLKPENQIKLDDYARAAAPPVKQKKRKATERYNPPPLDFLINSKVHSSETTEADSNEKARLLEETLSELKLPATVNAITRGPTVTRYELEMPPGIPIKRIEQFAKDIEYSLAIKGKIRIETPIPGKRAVGVEIPNDVVDIVRLKDILASKEFVNSVSPVTLALGKDIAGSIIVCQLEKMPHLLIAGQTGSGKSACLNSIIMSILYKASPDDVRIILIDPKRVEFTVYRDMPHLLTGEIITESAQTLNALKWLKIEMERRYTMFSLNVVRNLSEYNKLEGVRNGEMEKLPVLILVIDEMADLMLSDNRKDLEERIMNLAAKSRAAGIHLILATQRPSVDVITGTIKANLPSCIAFAVKSVIDSRTILDSSGAEALLGNGDMIYAPAGNDFTRRVQGAYVTNEEVTEVVNYVRENNVSDFDEDFKSALVQKEDNGESGAATESEFDALVPDVLKLAIGVGQISATFIQQRFSVGYPRAAKIMYQLEKNNFISANEGNKPRTVFITRERYKELFNEEI